MSLKGRPLPKFGKWAVNNPALAEGFSVTFNKARAEKTSSNSSATAAPKRNDVSSRMPDPKEAGFAVLN